MKNMTRVGIGLSGRQPISNAARISVEAALEDRLTALMRDGVVIKVGGSLNGDTPTLIADIKRLQDAQVPVTVVHGGGKAITKGLEDRGIESVFRDGVRVTTKEMIGVVENVLCTIGESMVTHLTSYGIRAVHVKGNRNVLRSVPDAGLGHVGRILKVDIGRIKAPAWNGNVTVLTPVGFDHASGRPLNVNADTAAGAVAMTMRSWAIFLTDVPGVMVEGRIMENLCTSEIARLIAAGVINGGMIPKIQEAVKIAQAGIPVRIVDGREPYGVIKGLFFGTGGTSIQSDTAQEGY